MTKQNKKEPLAFNISQGHLNYCMKRNDDGVSDICLLSTKIQQTLKQFLLFPARLQFLTISLIANEFFVPFNILN
jgi:hypothetical protein